MNDLGTPRQRARWHHAAAELDDFAIISYRVDPGRIAALLPPGVVPEVLAFDDGGRDALVSAVAFRDRGFHFRFCPPARMSCGQINYRAYVRVNGERGVWFFGTDLDHPLVLLPRLLWQMPWQRARISIAARPLAAHRRRLRRRRPALGRRPAHDPLRHPHAPATADPRSTGARQPLS